MDNLKESAAANETDLNLRLEEKNEKLATAETDVETLKANIIQMQIEN